MRKSIKLQQENEQAHDLLNFVEIMENNDEKY
jgi:hypothetical protein